VLLRCARSGSSVKVSKSGLSIARGPKECKQDEPSPLTALVGFATKYQVLGAPNRVGDSHNAEKEPFNPSATYRSCGVD